jgi:hypothetical protein
MIVSVRTRWTADDHVGASPREMRRGFITGSHLEALALHERGDNRPTSAAPAAPSMNYKGPQARARRLSGRNSIPKP